VSRPEPLGVVLMVYEARPTVTVEGALLGAAVGNAVLLRGGREIAATNAAMAVAIGGALEDAGLPRDLVAVLDDPDRSRFRALLKRSDAVDVLIPRGSPSLIDYCRSASSIPVIASGGGVNHLYVHASADLELAARATLDSKMPEPTACNSLEVVLVDRAVAPRFVGELTRAARRGGVPVEIRVDEHRLSGLADDDLVRFSALGPADFGREFLDRTVGVREVDGIQEALAHVERHGTGHTEGVIAADEDAVRRFQNRVDAAAIVVNGSLRLHDGPTLGLGPELAISTGRLHVRGPVTLASLVTRVWVVDAAGTLRADADRRAPRGGSALADAPEPGSPSPAAPQAATHELEPAS
jgi:glutamate-5-semialdehyde dehydrogenase